MTEKLPQRCLKLYFSSWWLPVFAFLILLIAFAAPLFPYWNAPAIWSSLSGFLTGVAFLGLVSASAWNLFKKRWAIGALNIVFVFMCSASVYLAADFIASHMLDRDGFADNLVIPRNIQVYDPGKELEARPGEKHDAFQAALLAALQTPGNSDATVSGSISSLLQLQKGDRAILLRYLASSPAWRVFETDGEIFATRRWMIGSHWRYTLGGYYTLNDIDTWSKSGIPNFEMRFMIGLSGKPNWQGNADTTWLTAGELKKVKISIGNPMDESDCVISAGTTVVEVFERSETPERRLTKAALSFLQAELKPLAKDPSWKTARRMLSPGDIRHGKPSFEIRNSFQPGIYDSAIWMNPGEPGKVYLKAFEVTKGTPLSVERLKDDTSEWVGWSSDPKELFFSNANFTIYEGDWGKPYAARLEVWFKPDSGGADRKLMEKVFKIEGWQR